MGGAAAEEGGQESDALWRGGWGLRAGLVGGTWLVSLGGAALGATAPHPDPSRNGALRAKRRAAGAA